MKRIYFAVMKAGAAQTCFDNNDNPAAALAKAIAYVEERVNREWQHIKNDWREHETQVVVKEDGANVFAWAWTPVTVTIEELSRDAGPYQHGKPVAQWVGGKRVL